MQLDITNQKLLSISSEIDAIAPTGVGILLAEGIEGFYKKNGEKLKGVQVKIREIQEKYLVFENGKIVFPKLKDGAVATTPVFKLGCSEEQLQSEYKELMAKPVSIEV